MVLVQNDNCFIFEQIIKMSLNKKEMVKVRKVYEEPNSEGKVWTDRL